MKSREFNLRHLRAFCAVARRGSISAAADSVHLSQPAITQALAKLEEKLEVALFVRQNRGMFLTEPGELFANRTERALRNIQSGARVAARTGSRSAKSGFRQFDQLVTNVQLRALLAVAETGNFSWAARTIGVSQPSLHRAARDLERISGVVLFSNAIRGIELTPAAEALAQHASLAYAELRQGVEEVDAWLGRETSEIRIGSLPLARSRILPIAISEMTRLRPEVRICVVDGPYADLLNALRHGQVDVVIGALRDPPPVDDVVEERLFSDELAIVARAGHPLALKQTVSLRDLAHYPWVAPAPGIPTREHFDALFRDAGATAPSQIVESSSLVLIRGLLERSDRLTIISAHQIQREVDEERLRFLNFSINDAPRAIGLTARRDWQPTAAQALFLDQLRQASRENPTLESAI